MMYLGSLNEKALIYGAEQAMLKFVLVLSDIKTTKYKNCLQHVAHNTAYRSLNIMGNCRFTANIISIST